MSLYAFLALFQRISVEMQKSQHQFRTVRSNSDIISGLPASRANTSPRDKGIQSNKLSSTYLWASQNNVIDVFVGCAL